MINGILNVYKEAGFTSHDVVAKLRGILKQKKIGHTGTLDPDATGVLPVCLGKATKLCDLIGDWDKTYQAVLLLGKETDTEDLSGKVLRESEVEISPSEITRILLSFVGTYNQIPPMYSAKKQKGKKLYELARQGIVVERKPSTVFIHHIQILSVNLPYVEFEVTCSKGTYIRSLCRDAGQMAGCGGCMASLVRTRVSDFSVKDSITLSQIENLHLENALEGYIHPIDSVFTDYPFLTVKEEGNRLLMNGNSIPMELVLEQTREPRKNMGLSEEMSNSYKVYDHEGHFIGLYGKSEQDGIYKPEKLFFDI